MTATTNDTDEIKIGELVAVLWKGKYKILLGCILGVAAGAFLYANTRPTFQADALLQLEQRRRSMAVPASMAALVDPGTPSAAEIELLRSRLVLGQAIADLNLDWRVEPNRFPLIGTMLSRYHIPILSDLLPVTYARPGDSLTLEQLIVPPRWLNEDLFLTLGENGTYEVLLPDGSTVSGSVGESLSFAETGFAITVGSVVAPPGRSFVLQQVDELRALDAVRGVLAVAERGRNSGILEARIQGRDRAGTARILNAIVQAYQRQNVSRSAAEMESSLNFIARQLPQAEANLREAEAALNAFRQEQLTVDLTIETQTILTQINALEAQLIELQRREDEISQRYTQAHPTYRQLLDERSRLETRLDELREQAGGLPETQLQILNLTRSLELALRIYTDLQTRAQEIEVLRASSIGNVRIIDPAVTAREPVAPRRGMLMGMGLVLGLVLSAGGLFLRDWLRKGVQDSKELERLGLPVFATINYSKSADTSGGRRERMPVLAVEQPDDLTIEAIRSLRTSLHFGLLDARTPTLTITSSHPGAGKSFLAMNLAVVAAQAGQSICLVDADMRRGQLRRYFGQERNAPGLAEVLAGDIAVDKAVIPGPVDGMHFLGTGRYPPNPADILMRREMTELIDWCSEHFDLTLFDAPPVLAVTDPVILAKSTGAAIFVARHALTEMGEIEASIKTFAAAGLKFSGTVLNGFDPRKAKAGTAYGYGYRYDYKKRPD